MDALLVHGAGQSTLDGGNAKRRFASRSGPQGSIRDRCQIRFTPTSGRTSIRPIRRHGSCFMTAWNYRDLHVPLPSKHLPSRASRSAAGPAGQGAQASWQEIRARASAMVCACGARGWLDGSGNAELSSGEGGACAAGCGRSRWAACSWIARACHPSFVGCMPCECSPV